jgi:uncharacterized phage-associated protein
MENVMDVAAYICSRYQETYGEKIDEMKLHKLMYFAQREALAQTGEPVFEATFRGWKYGPVLTELRKPYKQDTLNKPVDEAVAKRLAPVMDVVFQDYAEMPSFSLTRLTHGELSWRNSRKGIAPADVSDRPMELEDIRMDAERIRSRRKMLKQQGLL